MEINNPTIEVVGEYKNCKSYVLLRCKKCGDEFERRADKAIKGIVCRKCKSIKIKENNKHKPKYKKIDKLNRVVKDNLQEKMPDVAKMLLNSDDGLRYTCYSMKKIYFKCPYCNSALLKSISNVSRFGLSCDDCSDGISLPEKFILNVLKELKVDFVRQYSNRHADWINTYRYDFYIKTKNCIIEVNGQQHYKACMFNNYSLEEAQINDYNKKQLALSNGVKNYIVIDAKKSEKNYLKESVLNSGLSNLFEISKINLDKCYKNSMHSYMVETINMYLNGNTIKKISETIQVSKYTIIKWLKDGIDNGQIKISEINYSDVELLMSNKKYNKDKVICLNTMEVFKNVNEARRLYGAPRVWDCCNGTRKHSGKDKAGYPLKWMYYTNFIEDGVCENQAMKFDNNKIGGWGKKVICLNNNQVYNNSKHAKQTFPMCNVYGCLKGTIKNIPVFPNSNEEFKWMYYEDYIRQQNQEVAS